MKSLLIIALALITSAQAMAATSRITLKRNTKVFQRKAYSNGPVEFVTLLKGTDLEVNMNPAINSKLAAGQKLVRVKIIYNDHLYHGRRYQSIMDINSANHKDYRNTGKAAYFMNKKDVVRRRKKRRVVVEQPRYEEPTRYPRYEEPTHYPRYEDRPGYSDSRRGYEDRPRYDDNSYELCYEGPRRRHTEVVNQRRYNRGANMGGFGLVIGAIGLATGGRGGDIAAGIGAGLGIAGLLEMAGSTQTFFENGNVDCRRYYQTQRRQVYINSQSCTTTRYYSSQWSGYGGHSSHEYFQTTCSGRSYMTFDRHQGVW